MKALSFYFFIRFFLPSCPTCIVPLQLGKRKSRLVLLTSTKGCGILAHALWKCGFSSSGRAPPCQGGGSEFEPRKPLQNKRIWFHMETPGFKSRAFPYFANTSSIRRRSGEQRRLESILHAPVSQAARPAASKTHHQNQDAPHLRMPGSDIPQSSPRPASPESAQ